VTNPEYLEGGSLRITFPAGDDRYPHTIAAVDGDRLLPFLASAEGSPNDFWPPSPPLKDLHFEQLDDNHRIAMLVGLSGRSHWSMSVEIEPVSGRVLFDVACRLHEEPPVPLASTYRTMVAAEQVAERAIELAAPDALLRIEAATSCDESISSLLEVTATGFAVRPAAPHGPLPRTVRWQYVVCRVR
jgi:hypothetical protein